MRNWTRADLARVQRQPSSERLLARDQYDDRIQEHFALATEKALLAAELVEQERAGSDEYAQLEAQLAESREQTDTALDGVFERHEFPEVVTSMMETNRDPDRSEPSDGERQAERQRRRERHNHRERRDGRLNRRGWRTHVEIPDTDTLTVVVQESDEEVELEREFEDGEYS